MQPLVTVIIPAKNEASNIGRCIKSILNVDYNLSCLEIIVVDNGSSDNTVSIAKELGVKVIEFGTGTISELRNFGAKDASGDVLAFIDADVCVARSWLINALRCFEETGAVCVGSSPLLPPQNTWIERAWHYQIDIRPQTYEKDWLVSMNMLVKKNIFNMVNGFDPNLYTCEDVDLGYRLKKYGKIISDKSISAIHFGEAKNCYDLFRKESWRGISNFEGLAQHGLLLDELPSHIVASFYALSYPLLIILITVGNIKAAVFVVLLSFIIPLIKTCMLIRLPINFVFVIQIWFVWFVYCWARGFSGYRLIIRKFKT